MSFANSDLSTSWAAAPVAFLDVLDSIGLMGCSIEEECLAHKNKDSGLRSHYEYRPILGKKSREQAASPAVQRPPSGSVEPPVDLDARL